MVMTKDRQTQQRKATTSKEVSEARALWRAGKVTKPEYAQFCNQIHLPELQASKRDMGGEEAMRVRRHCQRIWSEAGERAQHTRDRNGAQGQ